MSTISNIKAFPATVDVPMDLSLATRMFANTWTNHDDRYMIQAYHSDHWWSDEFMEVLATEVDERVAMIPNVYPSFQVRMGLYEIYYNG